MERQKGIIIIMGASHASRPKQCANDSGDFTKPPPTMHRIDRDGKLVTIPGTDVPVFFERADRGHRGIVATVRVSHLDHLYGNAKEQTQNPPFAVARFWRCVWMVHLPRSEDTAAHVCDLFFVLEHTPTASQEYILLTSGTDEAWTTTRLCATLLRRQQPPQKPTHGDPKRPTALYEVREGKYALGVSVGPVDSLLIRNSPEGSLERHVRSWVVQWRDRTTGKITEPRGTTFTDNNGVRFDIHAVASVAHPEYVLSIVSIAPPSGTIHLVGYVAYTSFDADVPYDQAGPSLEYWSLRDCLDHWTSFLPDRSPGTRPVVIGFPGVSVTPIPISMAPASVKVDARDSEIQSLGDDDGWTTTLLPGWYFIGDPSVSLDEGIPWDDIERSGCRKFEVYDPNGVVGSRVMFVQRHTQRFYHYDTDQPGVGLLLRNTAGTAVKQNETKRFDRWYLRRLSGYAG